MSTDIDPVQDGQPPEPTFDAPAPGPDWSAWEQAGIDPSAFNPVEVTEAVNLRRALSSRDQRPWALQEILRTGGDLPEGVDWDTVRGLAEQHAQAAADPWAELTPQQQAGEDEVFWSQDGRRLVPAPEAPVLDPDQIRKATQAEIAAARQEWTAEQQQRELERDFGSAIERIAQENGLDDNGKRRLATYAAGMYGAIDTTYGQPDPREVVGQAWSDMQEWRGQAAVDLVQRQAATNPSTTAPESTPTPTGEDSGPADLAEARRRGKEFYGSPEALAAGQE